MKEIRIVLTDGEVKNRFVPSGTKALTSQLGLALRLDLYTSDLDGIGSYTQVQSWCFADQVRWPDEVGQ